MTWHQKTAEAAKGQWRGILKALGVPPEALTGKHCACPMCGGTDRFRFDNKEGAGTYICNACGAGDGMKLAVEFTGREFRDVAAEIDKLLGNEKFEPDKPKPAVDPDEVRRWLRQTYAQSVPARPGDLVDTYLTARGVGAGAYPKSLRFARALSDGEGGVRPCMVATVCDAEGKPATLHRTFLRPDGGAKAEMASPRKTGMGPMPEGGAVRLTDDWQGGALGIAEGIETALAASLLFEMPVWSAINATMLAKWVPPEGCTEVAIFGDHDANYAGQSAAFTLAHRLMTGKTPVAVTVHIPDLIGADWNDHLLLSPYGTRMQRRREDAA